MSKRMTVIFEDEGLYTALKVEAARKCCATHKAVGWSTHEATADAPARMVLYWTAPERVEGYAPLPFAAGQGQIAVIVQGWLDSVDCGTEPDHDGDNAKGFRLYNEGWGHVDGHYQAFMAVQPAWAMYGK